MDPDLKLAESIAAFYQWQEEHPGEAEAVGFEFIEATDTSLNFKASGMLFQLILPTDPQSKVGSDELFIAMTLDNKAPDGLLMALNDKLERVQVGPCALQQVLDVFSKALISFGGKRAQPLTTSAELQSSIGLLNGMVGIKNSNEMVQAVLSDDDGSEDGSDWSGGNMETNDDAALWLVSKHGDDDNDDYEHFAPDDLDIEAIQRSLENFFEDYNVRKVPGEAATNNGYLHVVSSGARDRCEQAQWQSLGCLPSPPAKRSCSGALAESYMNDILQFCNVSVVPNLSWVRIQAEVPGIVSDVKLAAALGLHLCNTIQIFLEFDEVFCSEQALRKPLDVNRVTVKLESSSSGKGFTEMDNGCVEYPGKNFDQEFEEEWKRFPGRQKATSYAITNLLPELILTFFRYRTGQSADKLRAKPWDNGPLDDALKDYATIKNPFIGLICFLGTQLRALPSWCAICWSLLPASVWRLRTCQNDLCLYEFEELGLGAAIHQDIRESPEVVQFELSLACAAAITSRDVFEPFPAFFLSREELRGRSGWFTKPSGQVVSNSVVLSTAHSGNETQNKKLNLLLETLQSIPSMTDLKECTDENSLKRKLSKASFDLWRNKTPSKRSKSSEMWLSYDLMRFILSTNRLSLRVLKGMEQLKIDAKPPKYQFVVLHDSPEKEAIFEEHKSKRGSFFAFHGSGRSNWYSILRNGLRSMSQTKYMSSGAANGDGIYLADNFDLSYSYAKTTFNSSHWKNGDLHPGIVVMAICEVVAGSTITQTGYSDQTQRFIHGVYVVPPGKEDDVSVRYLLAIEPDTTLDFGSNCCIRKGSILQNNLHASNSIDLHKHYEALRRGDRMKQQKILLDHRMKAFLRVKEKMTCWKTNEADVSSKPAAARTDSSCSGTSKTKEQIGSHISGPARGQRDVVALSAPKRFKESKTVGTSASSTATATATQAITKEFRNVQNEIRKAKQGKFSSHSRHADSFLTNITVDIPNETDMYIWHVSLHQNLFRSYPKLFKDLGELAALRKEAECFVLLEVNFSGMYPFEPPFIRVIRPRFLYHTGHVTSGGSICMELLTESGWLPSFSFENVLVQIVNAFVEGEGRIDKTTFGSEYSKQEAQDSFTRVAGLHGWKVSRSKQ